VEPVNGVVHPPVHPPPSRPGRLTNQLVYIRTTVMKGLFKHQHSWPFLTPVDTVKLGLPDYFKIIKSPMDLGTIRKRLDNNYYWCARECIDDVHLMFNNCYLYNKPGEDVTVMAQSLEKFFLSKLKSMPPVEVGMPPEAKKGATKTKSAVPRARKMLPPGSGNGESAGGVSGPSDASAAASESPSPLAVDAGTSKSVTPEIKREVKAVPKIQKAQPIASVLPDGSMLTPAIPPADVKPDVK